jgi:hypothetical protein
LIIVRLAGKAIKTMIIDLSQMMAISEDILRYAFHELNAVE